MKKTWKPAVNSSALILSLLIAATSCLTTDSADDGIGSAFRDKFFIGAALNQNQIRGLDSNEVALIEKNFTSITAENIMKWKAIHPEPGKYDFELSDRFVEFGEENGMFMVGHTLVWHNQTPDWVFLDAEGNLTVRDTLLQRMRDHIFTVMGRYKGRIQCWDVVNEALEEDGTLRQSKWAEIIGNDFIHKAFEYAREADPDAMLIYNDHSLPNPRKREGVVRLVSELQENGIQIDGVGMQGHYNLDYPSLDLLESSILAFSELGVRVMITELDIDVLPGPVRRQGAEITYREEFRDELDPFKDELPDSIQNKLTLRYTGMFELFLEHCDKVHRVTFWGVHDGQSWKNNWPVRGRTNHPLLFDRALKPKPAYHAIMDLAQGPVD